MVQIHLFRSKTDGMARGRKSGGRRRGTPNKATTERALIAARTVADAKAAGKKLAKEILEDFMLLFAGMAAHFQPAPPSAAPNPHADEDNFWKCSEAAIDCADKLAPYQSPTFKAVAVVPPPAPSPVQLERGHITRLDDPVALAEVYRRLVTASRRQNRD
jgi:hypothetical protein